MYTNESGVFEVKNTSTTIGESISSPNNMTNNTLPLPFVASATSETAAGKAFRAFNGNESSSSGWETVSGSGTVHSLVLDMGGNRGFFPKNITIHNDGSGTTRVQEFSLYGSNDSVNWNLLVSGTNPNSNGNHTFNFSSNIIRFRYMNFSVESNYGASIIILDELYIFGEGFENNTTKVWNRTISESIIWGCESCNFDEDCGFSSVNRTVTFDNVSPVITIIFPLPIIYEILIPDLNYTSEDISGDKCWYSTDGGSSNSSSVSFGVNFTGVPIVNGTNNWTVYCNDSVGLENFSTVSFNITENTNLSINLSFSNIDSELGGNILVNATSNVGIVCVDIDHPDYGVNYSCENFSNVFNLSIDYFRKIIFNNSLITKTLEFIGTQINNIFFPSHQWDEVVNMSINITGINTGKYPENVLINSSNTSIIDRFFPGLLIGNNIFLDRDANNDSEINLAYTNKGSQSINMFMDDNGILSNFTFNITGLEFGVEFFDSLINDSFIDIIKTNGQLDKSGVIMPANSSLLSLIWDDFDDSSVDNDKWDVSADFSQSSGSGIDCDIERHVTEQNGEIRLRSESTRTGTGGTGCGVGLSFIVSNISKFNLFARENIIVEMNATTVTDADGDDCDGALYVFLGNTEVWQGNPLFEINGLSTSTAKIIFNFTKINSTSWSAHLTGFESRIRFDSSDDLRNWTSNEWTRTNGTVQILINPFIVDVTYNTILPLGFVAEDDASENGCKTSFSNAYFNIVNNSLWNRVDGSVFSKSVYDSGGTITDATLNASGNVITNETATYYMSANDGDNWEIVTNGIEHSFTFTGRNLKWRVDFNMTETGYKNVSSYIESINITTPRGFPTNISIDFGNDGIADFTFDGELNNTNSPMFVDVSSADLSASLATDPVVGNHLNLIPLEITSGSVGQINVDTLSFFYNPNPVKLVTSAILNFINSSLNFIDFPISIKSTGGNITVNDVRFDYAGGNDTINILAHNEDYSQNVTRNITYYYSRWDYDWIPSGVEWIYFAPGKPDSVNITPYGQTPTTPILNVTNYGYGGRNATLSIYQNGTSNCVNVTMSLDNNKLNGFLLNESFIELTDLSYLEAADIFLWADYNCTFDTWHLFEPQYYFRQCVDGGICSTELI